MMCAGFTHLKQGRSMLVTQTSMLVSLSEHARVHDICSYHSEHLWCTMHYVIPQ